jgi:hypothetical protein
MAIIVIQIIAHRISINGKTNNMELQERESCEVLRQRNKLYIFFWTLINAGDKFVTTGPLTKNFI